MITDGTFVCALCGEWMTGCPLCDGHAPLLDMRKRLLSDRIDAEIAAREEWLQEQAIRNLNNLS